MDSLINKIAGKLNLDEDVVEKAIRSQFRFVAETMQYGSFESVHLHYLGKYAVKPNAVDRLNKKKEIRLHE